ncbi:MAG: hypothetical protein ACOCUU_00015 [Nanoarchaeota archaeon]
MAIELLASDEIISHSEKEAIFRTPIREKATHYDIKKKRFYQYRVNPSPGKRMKSFPQGATEVEIEAEGHMHNVSYSVYFK